MIIKFQGLERTKNGHFGGGNTAWEEKNLLTYANSEIRLYEIYETLCTDTTQNQDMVKKINVTHFNMFFMVYIKIIIIYFFSVFIIPKNMKIL